MLMLGKVRPVRERLGLEFVEQVVTSVGTFLFMILGARVLGIGEFGVVSMFWAIIQLPSVFLFSLVLLPVSSTKDSVLRPDEVLGHALLLYGCTTGAFAALAPVLLWGMTSESLPYIVLNGTILVTWGASQSALELVRWVTIRYGDYRVSMVATLLRWTVFTVTVAIVVSFSNGLDYLEYSLLNIACIVLWLAIGIGAKPGKLNFLRCRWRLSRRQLGLSIPLLVNGSANASLNYLVIMLFARMFSIEALGAFQAYRSIANVFGMFAQFMDNHWTARIVRQDLDLQIPTSYYGLVALGLGGSFLCGRVLGSYITPHLLDQTYTPFQAMFPLLLMGAAAHLLVRPIVVSIRISGGTRILYMNAILVVFVLAPGILVASVLGKLSATIGIFSAAPLTVLIADVVSQRVNARDRVVKHRRAAGEE